MSGFKSGNVSFSVLRIADALPAGWWDSMEAKALNHAATVVLNTGWCGPKHVRDTDLSEASLSCGELYRGLFVQAERKIPASTLEAELEKACAAELEATGRDFMSLQARSTIKEGLIAELTPKMPVTYKGTEWVLLPEEDDGSRLLFCSATSASAVDAFSIAWAAAVGVRIQTLDAHHLLEVSGHNTHDWAPKTLSGQGELFYLTPGTEFLLWLWSMQERQHELNSPASFVVEGPITLVEDKSSVVVRGEKAPIMPETVVSLCEGMMPSKYKLTIAESDAVFTVTLSDDFIFRAVRVPKGDGFTKCEVYEDRVMSARKLFDTIRGWFSSYSKERADSDAWDARVAVAQKWLTERRTRYIATKDA